MTRHKRIVSILLIALVHLFSLGSAWAGTSASISVSGNEGAITVSASASFMEDTHCDNKGNCWPVNSGAVYVYQDNGYLGATGGYGSATFSTIVDGGRLSQGGHTFTATARDHEGGMASDSQTITIDNTPTVTVNSPRLVAGAFDVTGTVAFKESITGYEGTVYLYVDNGYLGAKSFEGTSINWKYSEMFGSMLNAGTYSQGVHTIKVVARAPSMRLKLPLPSTIHPR